jgi:hypothetical protein
MSRKYHPYAISDHDTKDQVPDICVVTGGWQVSYLSVYKTPAVRISCTTPPTYITSYTHTMAKGKGKAIAVTNTPPSQDEADLGHEKPHESATESNDDKSLSPIWYDELLTFDKEKATVP